MNKLTLIAALSHIITEYGLDKNGPAELPAEPSGGEREGPVTAPNLRKPGGGKAKPVLAR